VKRTLLIAIAALLLSTQCVVAQQWAKKMFPVTRHAFGTVAAGSKTEYSFELTNLYKEDVHIASVRASCGCTTPIIVKPLLKTFEKGAILARFNTSTFHGQKDATITVTIDKPFYAEVQLSVAGYIRQDVVFSPGNVEFGSLDSGKVVERRIKVDYAGRADWQITDVRSANTNLEVEMTPTHRQAGRVGYELLVRLKASAPVGYINDQLVLVTNDRNKTTVPLSITGRVLSPVTISPSSLFLGVLQPGQKVTKQLIVKGKSPFHITKVKCDDCFEIKAPSEAKKLHVIPVIFTAGATPGKISHKIAVQTDISGDAEMSVVTSATVEMPATAGE
jgi:hypothetical protein